LSHGITSKISMGNQNMNYAHFTSFLAVILSSKLRTFYQNES